MNNFVGLEYSIYHSSSSTPSFPADRHHDSIAVVGVVVVILNTDVVSVVIVIVVIVVVIVIVIVDVGSNISGYTSSRQNKV